MKRMSGGAPKHAEDPAHSHRISLRNTVVFRTPIICTFALVGYYVTCDQSAFTLKAVEDYYAEAREHKWHRPGHARFYEPGGVLVVEDGAAADVAADARCRGPELGSARVFNRGNRGGRDRFAGTN